MAGSRSEAGSPRRAILEHKEHVYGAFLSLR